MEPYTLSTGQPSTLKNWYDLAHAAFGINSKATLLLKEKMDEQGPDEPVIAPEEQLLYALVGLHRKGDKLPK